MNKKEKKYLCVSIRSTAGVVITKRIIQLNKILQDFDMQLITIMRQVEYYNSKSRETIIELLPMLYEYAFLEVSNKYEKISDVLKIIALKNITIEILGGRFINKKEQQWIEEQLKKESKTVNLTNLGTKLEINHEVRIVNGPFSGCIGIILSQLNKNQFVIEINGLKLYASRHVLRGLDYDATDNDTSSIIECVR